jgi:2-dehydro-3-deoxy-D-arabinonate dehydratase
MSLFLSRFQYEGNSRWGIHNGKSEIYLLEPEFDFAGWLRRSSGNAEGAIRMLEEYAHSRAATISLETFEPLQKLAPVDSQEIWASGVTYERSREARQEESVDGGDIYARVYQAERPELFFKGQAQKVIGHLGEVGIRDDATWSVPEPELAVVFNPAMEAVGFTIGNDMSSRDIEGANPLYLPQAKVYKASCALGPTILLQASNEWLEATIHIKIVRNGSQVFDGEVHTARIKRKLTELGSYLGHSNEFPDGAVLLTGTGIVPPSDFTLAADDVVSITIDGIGTLTNSVKVV